ncbi:autotransporter domain-containing protein, partial [Ancylobacter radicis]
MAQRLAEYAPHATFFFPNFQSPVPGRARAGGPRIVNVIHDVQFAYLPHLFSAERREALYATFAETRDNADEIVFISEAARDQFLATIGAPRQHRVIYNPIDAAVHAAARAVPPCRPYLLASLHHHPHKNFDGLLRFFARLSEEDADLELLLTGHGGEKLARLIDALPAATRTRVRHLGYVSRHRLDGLYRQARAFVSLSRFEGFNMSAAEAARHGTPLLLSDLPVHRELYEGLACFLDPDAPSVAGAQAYLAARALAPAPLWRFEALCRPEQAAAAYALVLDAQAAAGGRAPLPRRTRALPRNLRPIASSARPNEGPRGVIARCSAAMLAATVLTGASLCLSVPAFADGGAGGGRSARVRVDNVWVYYVNPGPAGGTGYSGEDGSEGGSTYYGGGGGGAGGGAGADGDPCGNVCGQGTSPGIGGAGGTAEHPDGSDGQSSVSANGNSGGGSGGGGGGYHGNGFSGVFTGSDLTGGNGGNGADGPTGLIGSAGGGGAGGYGALILQGGSQGNAATIVGGSGGNGGSVNTANQGAGAGGDGGVGVYFATSGVTFTNTGSITGGDGGAGGTAPAATGNYAALDFSGATGSGGAGVVGSDLTLINGGTISGGWSGDGLTQASAVVFEGGANVLTFLNATSGLSGAIELQNDASLTFAQATDVTVDNVITGTGTLSKTGTGTLDLTGDSSSFTGLMTVVEGRLALNGSLGGSILVGDGATLGGTGSSGSVTVAGGGTLAPGNSIGTYHVTGDVTFSAGSTYQVELDGSGNSDLLSATGQVTLNGATLSLMGLDPAASYADGVSYTILEATGGVVGTFGAVTTDSLFLTVDVNDLANGINVVISASDDAFTSVAVTPNQIATSAALGTLPQTGASLALYNSILFLTSAGEAQWAYDQLSGEVHASTQSLFMEQSSLIRGALNDRLRAAQGGVGASSGQVVNVVETASGALAYAAPSSVQVAADMSMPMKAAPALAPVERFALWSTAFGNWGEMDGNSNAAGVSDSTGGFLIGADTLVGEGWRVGLAGGYSYTDFSISGRNSSGSSDNWHIGLYAGNEWGPLALRTGLAYTWQDISTNRSVAFTGYSDSLSADYNAGTV